MMQDIRYTTISGIYESGNKDFPVNITFSEWWNGEGMDFTFSRNGKEERLSISIDEAQALATVLIATGFVDASVVETDANQLYTESKRRDREIRQIRSLAGLTDDE